MSCRWPGRRAALPPPRPHPAARRPPVVVYGWPPPAPDRLPPLAAQPSAAGGVECSGMTRAAKGRSAWVVVLGLAAVLLTAALPAPASASAPTPSYAETRVRGFELQIAAGVGVERALNQTGTEAYDARYDELAVGYPLVPRGVRYGPLNPGPLADDIAATFRSGSYTARTLEEPMTLYRVIGDGGRAEGSFWTATPPRGPLQSVVDLALDQNWGNTATTVIEARIPAGTTLYEGAAAAQRGLVGGGSQVYIPRVNPSWIVRP